MLDSHGLDLEIINTHNILSLRISRVVVPYCISPALRNKKEIEYRKQLGYC